MAYLAPHMSHTQPYEILDSRIHKMICEPNRGIKLRLMLSLPVTSVRCDAKVKVAKSGSFGPWSEWLVRYIFLLLAQNGCFSHTTRILTHYYNHLFYSECQNKSISDLSRWVAVSSIRPTWLLLGDSFWLRIYSSIRKTLSDSCSWKNLTALYITPTGGLDRIISRNIHVTAQ